MADIKLIKPQAGEKTTIQSAADARLEFAFSTADAIVEKSGNDLVFTFDDGSSVVLTDFYTAYTKETLPEFVVEGQTIAGSEFFAALGNDDLMPAAGPAAAQAAAGGRFREYDEANLMDGLDRLNGLDITANAGNVTDTAFVAPAAAFVPTVDTGTLADGSGVTGGGTLPPPTLPVAPEVPPVAPEVPPVDPEVPPVDPEVPPVDPEVPPVDPEVPPVDPEVPPVDPEVPPVDPEVPPVDPEVPPVNHAPKIDSAADLTVKEDSEDPVLGSGVIARDPDGDTLQYWLVGPDGEHVTSLTDEYGTMTINSSTGKYNYTLNNDNGTVQALDEGQHLDRPFTVGVSDGKGGESTKDINVVIEGTNEAFVQGGQLDFSESNLADGTAPDAGKTTQAGTVSVTADSGVDTLTVTIGGKSYAIMQGGTFNGQAIPTDDGTLTFTSYNAETGQLGYKYTLTDSANAADGVKHDFVVTVVENNKQTSTGHIVINVADDAPIANNDTITLEAGSTLGTGYNVLTGEANGIVKQGAADQTGADGATIVGIHAADGTQLSVVAGQETSIQGEYGKLTINADGSYTYTRNSPDADGYKELPPGAHETFTYTVKDADGDESSANLNIYLGDSVLHVKEAGEVGSTDGTLTNQVVDGILTDCNTLTLPDNAIVKELSLNGTGKVDTIITDNMYSIESEYGTFTFNASTGEYTFNLADNDFVNSMADGVTVNQTYTLTLADGSTIELPVLIEGTNDRGTITDDSHGGHASNRSWLDAKATGSGTIDNDYQNTAADANMNVKDQSNGGRANMHNESRVDGKLPFAVNDPDAGNTHMEYSIVYNKDQVGNKVANVKANGEGESAVNYAAFVDTIGDFSIALKTAWNDFAKDYTDSQLNNMVFIQTEFGIMVVDKTLHHDAVSGKEVNWFSFLVDSDAPAVKSLNESEDVSQHDGVLVPFTFYVKDSSGALADVNGPDGQDSTLYSIIVHLHGSNDAPTVEVIKPNEIVVHDADVGRQNFNIHVAVEGEKSHDLVKGGTPADNGEVIFKVDGGRLVFHTGKADGTETAFNVRYEYQEFENGHWSTMPYDQNIILTGTDKMGDSVQYVLNSENADTGVTLNGVVTGSGTHNDALYGGHNNDTLNGGEGNDRLFGGAGDDTLNGGTGSDMLVGGTGDDTLKGDAGNDILAGDGNAVFDSLIAGTANTDTLHTHLSSMTNVELKSFAESIESKSDGNDKLFGGSGDDILFGLGGDDMLYGGDGKDILAGGSGNDYMNGGTGADKLLGGSGNDIMQFDAADILVDGGSGTDFLLGSSGSMDEMLAGLKSGQITGVEVLVAGDASFDLSNIASLQDNLGITVGTDGKMNMENYTAGESHTVNGQTFVEYHATGESEGDKLTILVAQASIAQGG